VKAKLYPFQQEGVAMIEQFMAAENGVLLADSMGLGKTIQALTYLANHPELRPAVIVCPASIKGGWEQQARQHLNMRVAVLEGRNPQKFGISQASRQIFVINYDILDAWAEWLIKQNPKIVVGDEIHYCGNKTTIRTRAMKKLVASAGKFIAISGTPLTNNPMELWPTLNMNNAERWGTHHGFSLMYTHRRRTPWGWDYRKPKNLSQLHQRLKESCMIRRLKEDVLDDLPAKMSNVVPIVLSDRKEYNAAERDFRAWVVKNMTRPQAMRTLRAEAMTKMGHLKRLCAKLKMRHMIGWVENFLEASDQKIILFAVHRAVIEIVQKTFKGCAVVTGDVTGKDRDKEFNRFNRDKKCRVFVGNIKAAGVGWSASACSDVAFLELPWTPGDIEQASDRIRGIGRGIKGVGATSHFLIAANTVEEKICQMIEAKKETLDRTLNGTHSKEEMDIVSRLLDLYSE
jgi:SWI/SNF-related matrix-associated actin-dependent regulator 1 of chromatin subfamily A